MVLHSTSSALEPMDTARQDEVTAVVMEWMRMQKTDACEAGRWTTTTPSTPSFLES